MRTRYAKLFLLLLTLCALPIGARGQQPAGTSAPTFSGTEYYIGFPPSDPDANHQFFGLLISSEFTTNGTIVIPDVPASPLDTITSFTTKPFSVKAGEATMIEIPRPLELDYPGPANHNGEATRRTVHLTSRAPIAVTVVNARQGASGAYAVMPVDRWGTTYTPTALPATPNTSELSSQISITAAYNGTVIVVTPSAESAKWGTGETFSFTLDQGQTWLLQADATATGSRDLSGTTVVASHPVGVVSGHARAALGEDPTTVFARQKYAAWHAAMQLPIDRDEWGTEYYSTPMRTSGDRFRLIARDNNTTARVALYTSSGQFITEKVIPLRWRGQVVDVVAPEGIHINSAARWSADKPFSLTQLRLSTGDYPDPMNNPAMLRLIPGSLYTSRSVIALPDKIQGEEFGDFRCEMIVRGSADPLREITLDGVPLADLGGATVGTVTGDVRRVSFTLPPGGHVIRSGGNARFTGRVRGDNGTVSGVVLEWELPHWSAEVEADVEPPYMAEVPQEISRTEVQLQVSDRTTTYFSGVDDILVHNSPGWERISFDRPIDPDLDAIASFRVRPGVDPSGPLVVLLRDRDGNETTTQIHDGVCLKTAYAAEDDLSITVNSGEQGSTTLTIDANPCGDAATVTWIGYDLGNPANTYLQAPKIVGGSVPYGIAPNGSIAIEIATKPSVTGDFTGTTSIDLIIDGQTHSIPVHLRIVPPSAVGDDEAIAGTASIRVYPNPFRDETRIALEGITGRDGTVEIVNALGIVVRTFPVEKGEKTFVWDGTDEKGTMQRSGFYLIRFTNGESEMSRRVVLAR